MTRPITRPITRPNTPPNSPSSPNQSPTADQLSTTTQKSISHERKLVRLFPSTDQAPSIFSRVGKRREFSEIGENGIDDQRLSKISNNFSEPFTDNASQLYRDDSLGISAGIDIKYNGLDPKNDDELLAMMFANLETLDANDAEEPTSSRNSQSNNPSSHQNLRPTTSFQALDRDHQQRLETSPQQTASQQQPAFVRPIPSKPRPYSATPSSTETTITPSFQLNPNSGFRRPIKPIADNMKERGKDLRLQDLYL
ncbi:MAG: hypothetical protein ACKO47_02070 [Alphaproteobacteria bacterium]